ncbi:class I SAM-dependent methyltransferase [Inquilinus sp. YAF38]|uniref:class I SAM-dependent methyltransferase n=1 Tax=Inquilinus sp. YAF38 TaxID=3233084 RepID=UPI003F8F2DF8
MTALLDLLRRRIAVDGPLTVAQYMAEALGHPRHGYYVKQDPLGAAGDFTTAPEISQVFGELIGLWCADLWQRMGTPDPVLLVELGPGRGTLMQDALRAIGRAAPGFRAALRLHLVETSPALRAAQATRLADAAWLDRLADLAEGPAVVVANEFFDALPIRQWQRGAKGWHERLVGWDEETCRLHWELSARADPGLALIPEAVRDAPEGSIAEACPAGLSHAALLGRRLAQQGGAALIVDYGPARSAPGDSLQAVRRHAFADPLEAPGDADLTAHVDFQSLAQAASQAGAIAHGPVTQGAFLETLGLRPRAAQLQKASPARAAEIDAAVARLAGPQQMGTLFKALALTAPGLGTPAGFP